MIFIANLQRNSNFCIRDVTRSSEVKRGRREAREQSYDVESREEGVGEETG